MPRTAVRRVTPKQAAAQIDASRPAGPGPSGWRSSYIALIRRIPTGPATLAAWANAWGNGKIADDLAELWTDTLIRPFYKPSTCAEPSRPIACSEALLKLALGSVFQSHKKELAVRLGEEQYGAGQCAGAPALVRDVRAMARLAPHKALAQLDYKNAFGSVERNDALEACTKEVPGISPALAACWGHGSRAQRLFVEVALGTWEVILIYGAVLQGGQDGQPTF